MSCFCIEKNKTKLKLRRKLRSTKNSWSKLSIRCKQTFSNVCLHHTKQTKIEFVIQSSLSITIRQHLTENDEQSS